jgi:hypothetical protein
MSSKRKRRNPTSTTAGWRGRPRIDNHIPSTSSTTTMPGSSRPIRRATLPAASTPTKNMTTHIAIWMGSAVQARGQKRRSPTTEPAVPGANVE